MRYSWLLLISLTVFMLGTNSSHAVMCGQGITCFNAQGVLNNGNQAATSPVIMYTAPSNGNGVKITAIYGQSNCSSSAGSSTTISIIHNSVSYYLFIGNVNNLAGTPGDPNLLLPWGGAVNVMPNINTDENGNPYILLSAGDSIAIQNNVGIPSSGSTSGTYYFHIVGQAY